MLGDPSYADEKLQNAYLRSLFPFGGNWEVDQCADHGCSTPNMKVDLFDKERGG